MAGFEVTPEVEPPVAQLFGTQIFERRVFA